MKWAPAEVKVVLHGQRVTGGYVLFQTKGSQWMIHRERLGLPAALRPMLAVTGPVPRDLAAWALEMKWDGVRALAFIEQGRVRLMSRTERDITVAYPELARLGAATTPQAAAAGRGDRGVRRGRLAGVRGAAAAHARHAPPLRRPCWPGRPR